jgi:phytoene dehydrogenase-like protein
VLVLGQDDLPPSYEIDGLTLPRAPFTFTAVHSPIARRILSELAVHQLFRRRATSMDPAFQVALPGHRLDFPLDDDDLDQEVEREFPEVRRPVQDFHAHAARSGTDLDRLIGRDLQWPPETFFERREFARASAHQSFDRRGRAPDPLGELPDAHPFRQAVDAAVSFASSSDPSQLGALATCRLYASWLRGSAALAGGYSWLRDTLISKIETYSGELRPRERVEQIVVRRGTATGVRIAGSDETVGCAYVLSSCDVTAVRRLLADRAPLEGLFERVGEPQARYFRYTLNVVVRAEGVPVGMARDVFYRRQSTRPPHGANLLHIEAHDEDERGRRQLCVEALLPRGAVEEDEGYLESVRERLLESLSDLMPFMEEHLLVVDSPHDGRDVQRIDEGRHESPSEPWHRGPRTMPVVYGFPVHRTLGLCALPIRTPIKRLLLCNAQVVPGLGLEGQFLTAWSAARIVTRSDRKKEWMRRGLWTKVEV